MLRGRIPGTVSKKIQRRLRSKRAAEARYKQEGRLSNANEESLKAAIATTSRKKIIMPDEDNNYYRQIYLSDYFRGYTSNGSEKSLYVYQPNDKKLAREYYRKNFFWACRGCRAFGEKVCLRINNEEVFAPLKHYCQPRNVEDIMKEQAEYQNLSLFGNVAYLERDAAFYSSSSEFDKFGPTEYKFGFNNLKRPNSRLIVTQKGNPQNVYHYHKNGKRWICYGCFKINGNKSAFGEFVNKDLYLPKKHICKSLTAEESEAEQQHIISTSLDDLQMEKLFEEQKYNLRRLYDYDFEYGIAKSGKSLLIVCEPSNRKFVREFAFKSSSVWYCLRCAAKKKSDTYVIKKDGLFYTSLKHKCQPTNYFDSICKQMALLNPELMRVRIKYLASQKGEEMPFPEGFRPSTSSSAAYTVNGSKKRSAAEAFGSSATVSNKRPSKYNTPGNPISDLLAKVPRHSVKPGSSNTVVNVFIPKKQPFPVKIPPSYKVCKILAPVKPLQPVQACSSNQSNAPSSSVNTHNPPVISLAPFDFACRNEATSYSNLPSTSVASHNALSNNTSSNTASIPTFGKKETQVKVENLSGIEEYGIKSVESVSTALLRFVDSKLENFHYESSLTTPPTSVTTMASSSSSPVLPFENDKVSDSHLNNTEDNDPKIEIVEHDKLMQPRTSYSEMETNTKYEYKFEPPTDAFIRATLEKLKIPFIRQAFHFWAEVLYSEVSPALTPGSTFNISSSADSFFKCLSCFFTGKENHFVFIKAGIQSYFYNNFKSFEPAHGINFSRLDVTSPEFQKLYYCNELSSIHFNFICLWLNCRIGIFGNDDMFEKYGKWENEENNPILLIENNNGFYKPILTLI